MVLSIGKGGSADYYVRHMADYYTGGNEPLGKWYTPSGQFDLQDGANIDKDIFVGLMDGVDPNGVVIGRDPSDKAKSRVPSYDLTFSAPKSISVLWAMATPEDRARLERIQEAAVRRALQTAQRYAAFLRQGRNGTTLVQLRPPREMFGALFQHGDARPMEDPEGVVKSDMNLHTHAVIFNLGQDAHGKWNALDARHLFQWKMALGATYHAALAKGLTDAFETSIRVKGRNGEFEVANLPDAIIDHFSRRRAEVVAQMRKHGLSTADAPELAAAIGRATREAKADGEDAESFQGRFDRWSEEMLALGYDPHELIAACLMTPPEATMSDAEKEAAFETDIAKLPFLITETNAVVALSEIHRYAAALCVVHGKGADEADRIVAEVRSNQTVPKNLLSWSDETFDAYIKNLKEKRQLVPLPRLEDKAGRPLYTAPDLLEAERGIWKLVDAGAQDKRHVLPFDIVERYIAKLRAEKRPMTAEQAQGLRWLTTEPGLVSVMEGGAGTGKSRSMRQVRDLYKNLLEWMTKVEPGLKGYKVLGCSAKWLNARLLVEDAGLLPEESKAAAKWIADLRAGKLKIDEKTLLIVDEAGQMGSRDLHELLVPFTKAGAKIVLTGDRLQQRSVGAGLALDIVVSRIGSLRLERTQRMQPQADDVLLHKHGVSREDAITMAYGLNEQNRRILMHGYLPLLRQEISTLFHDIEYQPSIEDVLIWSEDLSVEEARARLATMSDEEREALLYENREAARDKAVAWSMDNAATLACAGDERVALAGLAFKYLYDLPLSIASFRASELTEQSLQTAVHGHVRETKSAIRRWAAEPLTVLEPLDVLRWADGLPIETAIAKMATLDAGDIEKLMEREAEALDAAKKFTASANLPRTEDILRYARGLSWTEAQRTLVGMSEEERKRLVEEFGEKAIQKADQWADSPETITAADVLVHLYGLNREEAARRADLLAPDVAQRITAKHGRAARRAGQIWARAAATDFSYGPTDPARTFAALKAFSDHDQLRWFQTHEDALAGAVADWRKWRLANPAAKPGVVIAKSNADVRDLNRMMRDFHREIGLIQGDDVSLRTVDRQDTEVTLPIAIGEQIMFIDRINKYDVVNGSVATVEAMAPSAKPGHLVLTVLLAEDGRRITFDTSETAEGKGKPARLEQCYGITAFSSQGLTRLRAFAVIDSSQKSNSIYVVGSRAIEMTTLYASRSTEDQFLRSQLPLDQRATAKFSTGARIRSMARQMSRAYDKTTTMDALEPAWRAHAAAKTTRAEGYYEDDTLWWRSLSVDDQQAFIEQAWADSRPGGAWRVDPPEHLDAAPVASEEDFDQPLNEWPAAAFDEAPAASEADYGYFPGEDDEPVFDFESPDQFVDGLRADIPDGPLPGQAIGRIPDHVRDYIERKMAKPLGHPRYDLSPDGLALFKAAEKVAAQPSFPPVSTEAVPRIAKDLFAAARQGPKKPQYQRPPLAKAAGSLIWPPPPELHSLSPEPTLSKEMARQASQAAAVHQDVLASERLLDSIKPPNGKTLFLDTGAVPSLYFEVAPSRDPQAESPMATEVSTPGKTGTSGTQHKLQYASKTSLTYRYDSAQIKRERDAANSEAEFDRLLRDNGWVLQARTFHRNVNQDWEHPDGHKISVAFHKGIWQWCTKDKSQAGSVLGYMRNFRQLLKVDSVVLSTQVTKSDFVNNWLYVRSYMPHLGSLPAPDETPQQREAREKRVQAQEEARAKRVAEDRVAQEAKEAQEAIEYRRQARDQWARFVSAAAVGVDTLLARRGIDAATVAAYSDSVRFDKKYGYACFAHRDPDGAVVGFERKGEGGFNKQSTGSATKSLAVFSRAGGAITRFVIAEAGVDALSKAQLDGMRLDTAYLSTNGEAGRGGVEHVRVLAERHPNATFVLATDRDAGGDSQAAGWMEVLKDHPGPVLREIPERSNDWNNELRFASPAQFTLQSYAKDLRKALPALPPPVPSRPDLVTAWQLWEQGRPGLAILDRAINSLLGARDIDGPLVSEGRGFRKDVLEFMDGSRSLDSAITAYVERVFPGRVAWAYLEPHVHRLEQQIAEAIGAVYGETNDSRRGKVDRTKFAEMGAADYLKAIRSEIETNGVPFVQAITNAVRVVEESDAKDRVARHKVPERGPTVDALRTIAKAALADPSTYTVPPSHMHDDPYLYDLLQAANDVKKVMGALPVPAAWAPSAEQAALIKPMLRAGPVQEVQGKALPFAEGNEARSPPSGAAGRERSRSPSADASSDAFNSPSQTSAVAAAQALDGAYGALRAAEPGSPEYADAAEAFRVAGRVARTAWHRINHAKVADQEEREAAYRISEVLHEAADFLAPGAAAAEDGEFVPTPGPEPLEPEIDHAALLGIDPDRDEQFEHGEDDMAVGLIVELALDAASPLIDKAMDALDKRNEKKAAQVATHLTEEPPPYSEEEIRQHMAERDAADEVVAHKESQARRRWAENERNMMGGAGKTDAQMTQREKQTTDAQHADRIGAIGGNFNPNKDDPARHSDIHRLCEVYGFEFDASHEKIIKSVAIQRGKRRSSEPSGYIPEIVVHLAHHGGTIRDDGRNILLRGEGTMEAARLIVEMTAAKGRTSTYLRGSPEFKRMLAEQCFYAGIRVENSELQGQMRHWAISEPEKAEEAKERAKRRLEDGPPRLPGLEADQEPVLAPEPIVAPVAPLTQAPVSPGSEARESDASPAAAPSIQPVPPTESEVVEKPALDEVSAKGEDLARAQGWVDASGVIYNSRQFNSVDEARAANGTEGQGQTVFTSWSECASALLTVEAELISVEPLANLPDDPAEAVSELGARWQASSSAVMRCQVASQIAGMVAGASAGIAAHEAAEISTEDSPVQKLRTAIRALPWDALAASVGRDQFALASIAGATKTDLAEALDLLVEASDPYRAGASVSDIADAPLSDAQRQRLLEARSLQKQQDTAHTAHSQMTSWIDEGDRSPEAIAVACASTVREAGLLADLSRASSNSAFHAGADGVVLSVLASHAMEDADAFLRTGATAHLASDAGRRLAQQDGTLEVLAQFADIAVAQGNHLDHEQDQGQGQ